jgi:hypothetical protein
MREQVKRATAVGQPSTARHDAQDAPAPASRILGPQQALDLRTLCAAAGPQLWIGHARPVRRGDIGWRFALKVRLLARSIE